MNNNQLSRENIKFSSATQKQTTGLGSSRFDHRAMATMKLKSLESLLFDDQNQKDEAIPKGNKKEQIKYLQELLKTKGENYIEVEKKIEQYKREGELLKDFVNDQVKEYSLLLARQIQDGQPKPDLATMQERKKQLKSETIQLHNFNKVLQFELDVQQSLSLKLAANKQQMKKKMQIFDDYIKKTEIKIRQKQPNLDLNEMPQAKKKKKNQTAVGIIQKTADELLLEKNQLIEEQTKKIEQLAFQIQEITRTCILEKQELIKKIQDTKEEETTLGEKILNLNLRIIKIDKLEASISSDKSNTRGLSKETAHSLEKQNEEFDLQISQ